MTMKQGIVVILSGVSSVGKGDIRDLLLADKDLKLFYSVSHSAFSAFTIPSCLCHPGYLWSGCFYL